MFPYYAHICIMAWRTMLQEEVFLFVAPKSRFPFSECKKRMVLWSNHQMANSKYYHHILQKYYTSLYGQCPKRRVWNLSVFLWWKRQISAESVGSGSDMNYRYMIRCSWFLTKIIFWFTICYFIKKKNNASWARLGQIQVYTEDAAFKYPINSKMLIEKMRH